MVKILEQPDNQKSAMMDSSHERQSLRSSAGVCNGAGEPGTAPPERVPGGGEPNSAGAPASPARAALGGGQRTVRRALASGLALTARPTGTTAPNESLCFGSRENDQHLRTFEELPKP